MFDHKTAVGALPTDRTPVWIFHLQLQLDLLHHLLRILGVFHFDRMQFQNHSLGLQFRVTIPGYNFGLQFRVTFFGFKTLFFFGLQFRVKL